MPQDEPLPGWTIAFGVLFVSFFCALIFTLVLWWGGFIR